MLAAAALALVALVVSGVLGGGSPELLAAPFDESVDPPDPEPAPEPEPEPEPEPIDGVVVLQEVVDLSTTGSGVFQRDSAEDQRIPIDAAATAAAVDDVTAWLDALLTAQHRGIPADPATAASDAEVVAAAGGEWITETPLLAPRQPLTGVVYDVRVGARGLPEWVAVTVRVTAPAPTEAGTVTFAATDGGFVPVAVEVTGGAVSG